jgi:pimeloyl-ACP methyl ester carboxylesterase
VQGENRRDGISVSDGVELHYAVSGAGEPIVLLSGFAADSTFWAGMLPALTAHHSVVTFDPRGSGRSSSPDSAYSVSVLGGDVLAVLRAAGFGPAHVVGHSMGAGVAQ